MKPPESSSPIPVVAAVVARERRVLLCQRHDEKHLPLMWEFPGGKIDPGETPREALARELHEELGVEAIIGEPVAEIFHSYPSKTVWIRFYRATFEGTAMPIVHRELAWVPIARLAEYPAPPPNARVIERIVRGELHIH